MTYARTRLISLQDTPYYHLVGLCSHAVARVTGAGTKFRARSRQ